MNSKNLVLDVWERPKWYRWILLSLQHVFAMFGATVLVPILTGLDIGVALIGSGVGTLIYIAITKGKAPMYLGSSFAYISAIGAAKGAGGEFDAAFTGIILVGVIYVIVAVIIRFFGVKWLKWLLPSVIVGPMIMVIGLSLAPVAVGQITTIKVNGIDTATDWRYYVVALVTFLTIVIVAVKAKGFLKIIPFLIGIVAGYLMSLAVGLVDFEIFKDITFFSIPKFQFVFQYKPNFSAAVIFAPLAFVTIMEHIGDHQVLGSIMERDLLEEPGLAKTLAGDGVATLFAGLIGAPANTSYGENTGVVAMTKVGSVWVTGGAAVVAILLAFISPINLFIRSIPAPVLGAMSLVLFGMIAANGLKVIVQDKVDLTDMRNIIIISTMLVVGLGGLVIAFTDVIKIETMAIAAVIGILLNLFFKLLDLMTVNNFRKLFRLPVKEEASEDIEEVEE